MANRNIVTKVRVKQDDGTLGAANNLGAKAANVVLNDGHSVQQLADSYLGFIQNGAFVYRGATQPTNPNTCVWIDTGSTNGL